MSDVNILTNAIIGGGLGALAGHAGGSAIEGAASGAALFAILGGIYNRMQVDKSESAASNNAVPIVRDMRIYDHGRE